MFAFSVHSEHVIQAPLSITWAVLTDAEAWVQWSTVIHHLDGGLRLGDRPRFRLTPPAGRAYSFRPTITARTEPERLEWVGRTGLPGIFDGHHIFTLEADGPDRTVLRNSEEFSGLLAPLFRRFLVDVDEVKIGFDQLNDEVATRARSLS